MIGFLFGLAVGTAIGFLLGCIAAIGAKTGREADEMFKGHPQSGVDWISTTVAPIDRFRPELDAPKAGGVRVCSCIGNPQRGPYYVDPHCPFHGGVA